MKLKLISILILAIGAVALVGYISYVGLERLMNTLEETVQPDFREKDLQTVLYHISESENSIRIFTITEENRYLASYYKNLNTTQTLLKDLREKSDGDVYLLHHLDTIDQLLRRKTNIQYRIIRLKQDQNKINVYEELLEKIESLERRNEYVDSLKNAIEMAELTLEKEISEKETEIDSQQQLTTEEKKGFFKRLFGPSKKDEEEQLVKEQDLESKIQELDTLVAAKDTLIKIIDTLESESISRELEETLAEIKEREETLKQELGIIELDLTRRDNAQSNLIKNQVTLVQEYFSQIDMNIAQKASSYFRNVTDQITIVGSIFSMLFLVLVFIILHDINANQKNRKELELAKSRAETLAQAKDEFLSNMSHEIRTPINAIIGFSEQLGNSSQIQPEDKRQLNIIENASKHLLAIINDILDFAKFEAGKIKLDNIPFSVSENTQIVFDALLKKANDKNLNFEFSLNPSEALFVEGDPIRYRQILFNLTDNAIKFTDKGFVKILILYENGILQIKVLDTGIGLESKSIKMIFNKFDQINSKEDKNYGGTGLGLAIVKNLVDMQSGSIDVKSEIGMGSEFIVKLPLKKVAKKSNPISKDQRIDAPKFQKNLNILIVDDEEYNRLLIETVLNKYEIYCVSANSGTEAIEAFEKGKYNMVLMDLQMENLDGYETTKELRKKYRTKIPIIAVTATATGNIKEHCIKAGINDVLIKPILESDLINCIAKYGKSDWFDANEINEHEKNPHQGTDNEHDMNAILNLFQNDQQLANKMTRIYLESIQSAKSSFIESLNKNDQETIQKVAHKIIPSTRHMGFSIYAEKLKELEINIKGNTHPESIRDQTKELIDITDEITMKIKKLLDSQKEKIIKV